MQGLPIAVLAIALATLPNFGYAREKDNSNSGRVKKHELDAEIERKVRAFVLEPSKAGPKGSVEAPEIVDGWCAHSQLKVQKRFDATPKRNKFWYDVWCGSRGPYTAIYQWDLKSDRYFVGPKPPSKPKSLSAQ